MPETIKIPLLHDHHTHTSIYAALHNCIDLRFIRDKSEALTRIGSSEDETIIVLGWNNSLYGFTQEELDQFPPLIVCNSSLHSFLINAKARDKFIEDHHEVIEHIDNEEWVENNIYFILTTLASIRKTGMKQIKDFLNDLLYIHGIWRTEDMLLTEQSTLLTFQEAGLTERVDFWADPSTYLSLDDKSREQIKGLKIFTDGAIGAKTAALKTKYFTGESGFLNHKNSELFEQIKLAFKHSKAISIHAIGDLATEQVIDVLSDFYHQYKRIPFVRIEHCQFISFENALKAKELGITLSMQPNFNSDSLIYRDRLPKDYLSGNNPFRMLIDEAGFIPGKDLIFGSDGMPHGVQYAVEQSLFPPVPNQKLKLDEFVAGYCLDDLQKGFIEIEINEEKMLVNTMVHIN